MEEGTVTLRRYGVDQQLTLSQDAFVAALQKIVETRAPAFPLEDVEAVS